MSLHGTCGGYDEGGALCHFMVHVVGMTSGTISLTIPKLKYMVHDT